MKKSNFLQSPDFLLTTGSVELSVSLPLNGDVASKPYSYLFVVFASVKKGDTLIDINSVPLSLPKNHEIDFNGKIVVTSEKINIGDRYLKVYPVNVEIPQWEDTIVSPLFPVYSINQVENNLDIKEVESKVFHSQTWVSKRTASQGLTIPCSGIVVREDIGLLFVERAHLLYKKVWFKLDDSQEIIEGFAYIKDFIKTRINDRHSEVSFSLFVDGAIVTDPFNPVADILQDDNYNYLLDSDAFVILSLN